MLEDVVGPLKVVAELGRHRKGQGASVAHEGVVLFARTVWPTPGAVEGERRKKRKGKGTGLKQSVGSTKKSVCVR